MPDPVFTETYDDRPDDVLVFLQKLYRFAVSQGRQRDNEWMVDQLQGSLTGAALIWWTLLSDDIQSDFKKARAKMIWDFVPREDEVPNKDQDKDKDKPKTTTSTLKGHIKILNLAGEVIGYVGAQRYNTNPAYGHWDCHLTTREYALTVEGTFSPGIGAYLKIISEQGDNYLGATQYKDITEKNYYYWSLVYCDKGTGGSRPRSRSYKDSTVEAASQIWTLGLGQLLTAYWPDDQHTRAMELYYEGSEQLFMRLTGPVYKVAPQTVTMVFEL